jgi:hypothetical protein
METNTASYIEERKLLDASSLVELSLLDLSYGELADYYQLPSGNRAVMTNGDDTRVNTRDTLFHFPTKKKVYDENETRERVAPRVQTLQERGDDKRRSMMVFVNGVKVPDGRAFVYATQNGTDIFIPAYYFDETGNNDISCIVRDYSNNQYCVYYNQNATGRIFTDIPVKQTVKHFTNKNVLVWANGLLVPGRKYNVTGNGDTFDITCNDAIASSDIFTLEVAIEMFVSGRFTDHKVSSTGDLYMYVPKESPVLERTVLSQYMCDLYTNGYRVPAPRIKQVSQRHFYYLPGNITPDVYTDIVVNDRTNEEGEFEDFIDAFMQYEKWVDDNEIAEALSGNPSAKIQPAFVRKDTLSFPPANKYLTDDEAVRMMSNEQRATLMIEENGAYLRNLLKFWRIKEENYTVERNPAIENEGDGVNIILDPSDSDDDNAETRLLEVYVGEKKIPDHDIIKFSRWKSDNIKIPIDRFSKGPGVDKVRLYKYPVKFQGTGYRWFSVTAQPWYKTGIWKFVDNIPEVNGVLGEFDIDELRLFKSVTKEGDTDGSLFVDVPGASVYFRIIPKDPDIYRLEMRPDTEHGGTMKLAIMIPDTSNIKPDELLVIANPRVHFQRTYNLASTGDKFAVTRLILNPVMDGMAFPVITNDYLVKIWRNGRLMLPDLDYIINTPENNTKLTVTPVTFKKKLNGVDVIEVEVTGIKNKWFAYYDTIPETNMYGFIFFDKLEVPFSLDYMDMYIAGRKLTSDDVIVYTDRLIRVKNHIPLPYRDVVLTTRLAVDYALFEPFIATYLSNRNVFDVYIRQFCRDLIFDNIPVDDKPPVLPDDDYLDSVFEDEFPEEEGGTVDEDEEERWENDRFSPFIERLAHDYNRDINLVTKYFDSNVLKPIFTDEYLILLERSQIENQEIILDSQLKEDMSENFILDQNKYYRGEEEIWDLVHGITRDVSGVINSGAPLSENLVPLISAWQYASDIAPIDSNYVWGNDRLPKDVVFDINHHYTVDNNGLSEDEDEDDDEEEDDLELDPEDSEEEPEEEEEIVLPPIDLSPPA